MPRDAGRDSCDEEPRGREIGQAPLLQLGTRWHAPPHLSRNANLLKRPEIQSEMSTICASEIVSEIVSPVARALAMLETE